MIHGSSALEATKRDLASGPYDPCAGAVVVGQATRVQDLAVCLGRMTLMSGRDDFNQPNLRLLAQRAGYICAYPDCRQLTIGPSDDRKSRLTMVGVGAHITAAAPGGPRYDASITPEERASETNGIWMCQLHGKQVDDNASRHTAEDLRRWKAQHEQWVFARISSADSVLKHGITSLAIENIGPFRERSHIALGRHNVVFGRNGAGKSSLCQGLAAFAGGENFENLRRRWRLFGPRSPSMTIEAAVSVNGARTTVRLSEESIALRRTSKSHQTRLHVEINGNVSASWPQALFNILYLESQELKRSRIKDSFRRELRAVAAQLGMSEDRIWDALREELFCSSTFGSRIRRSAKYRAQVQSAKSAHFYEAGDLSGGERSFAVLDIALRMIRADPRPTPWMVIVDSNLFLGLDSDNKRRVVEALTQLDEPAIQTIVCVNSETDAIKLKAADTEKWIGTTVAGALTVHSFL